MEVSWQDRYLKQKTYVKKTKKAAADTQWEPITVPRRLFQQATAHHRVGERDDGGVAGSVSWKLPCQSVHEGRKCGKIWAEFGEAAWIWRTEKAVRMRYNHVYENTAEQG